MKITKFVIIKVFPSALFLLKEKFEAIIARSMGRNPDLFFILHEAPFLTNVRMKSEIDIVQSV